MYKFMNMHVYIYTMKVYYIIVIDITIISYITILQMLRNHASSMRCNCPNVEKRSFYPRGILMKL